jgi:predicted permease
VELAGPELDVVLPVYALIAVGGAALRAGAPGADDVRRFTDFTFTVFVPAQLFLAMARTDFRALAPDVPAAYFATALALCSAWWWRCAAAACRCCARRSRASPALSTTP